MSGESSLSRSRQRGGTERPAPVQYTAKDFQLEVLSKLAEVQSLTEALEESWEQKFEAVRDQRLVKFDSRALIALGAIALSITGYVIQEARSMRGRIARSRRREHGWCGWSRLRRLIRSRGYGPRCNLESCDGQAEIRMLIQARDGVSKKAPSKP